MIDRINRWAEVAEVRWLTSWGHFARINLAPALGLLDFEVQRAGRLKNIVGYMGHLTEDELKRPVVWIDDDLGHHLSDGYLVSEAKELSKVMKNELLLVATSQYEKVRFMGLLPSDLWTKWMLSFPNSNSDSITGTIAFN